MRSSSHRRALVAAVALVLVSGAAHATSVLPFNLEQLTARAGRVLVGTCQAVSVGTTAEGIPFTAYTFDVSEAMKGSARRSITVRQFGHREPIQVGGRTQVFRIQGLPSYKKGQAYLLFLTAESTIGLSSPVGLFQGAFRVQTGADGATEVVNGADNVRLFTGMDELPAAAANHRRGPVKLSLIRDLVRKNN